MEFRYSTIAAPHFPCSPPNPSPRPSSSPYSAPNHSSSSSLPKSAPTPLTSVSSSSWAVLVWAVLTAHYSPATTMAGLFPPTTSQTARATGTLSISTGRARTGLVLIDIDDTPDLGGCSSTSNTQSPPLRRCGFRPAVGE